VGIGITGTAAALWLARASARVVGVQDLPSPPPAALLRLRRYTGHGNAHALHAAHMLSEMVQRKEPAEVDLFRPARFVEERFYR
jgi:UDP-N-acetylmuramoylalanine-D-glutamate ligase